MSDLEKYLDQIVEQRLPAFESPPDSSGETTPNLIAAVLRRWRIALFTFLAVCSVGIPIIWLVSKAVYDSTAAIRVAPVIPSILFSDKDSEGVIPMYDNFKNTQADIIASEMVLQRVADDLAGKKLKFFEKSNSIVRALGGKLSAGQNVELVAALKESLAEGDLSIASERKSELIKINMRSTDPKEASQIVDSFIRAYMSIIVDEEAKGGDQSLTILENEAKSLANKLESQRRAVREMAQEYGTRTLDGYHEMMLQRVASLQTELTKAQTRKIILQAQVDLPQDVKIQGIDPERLMKIRQDFINADLMIQSLTANIAQMEQVLISDKQTLASANPEIPRKAELLKMLKERLDQRREEVNKNFDETMAKEFENSGQNAKVELKQLEAYEKRFSEILAKEDSQTIELGRKQLTIEDLQGQLNLTKELYEKVQRRIQELEMEKRRPARVSVAYYANTIPVQNKSVKYTIALILGAMACGTLLAFLKNKADLSLCTPEDIVKRIGIRIIGTTTSTDTIEKALLPRMIAEDYQAIRTNLGLFDGEGIPKKLVITSPGMGDGKTTFSINLATSMIQSGKKVLLIDGDLRKPDIAHLLNLPRDSRHLQDVLVGKEGDQSVCSITSSGLDVLAADSYNKADAYELLNLPLVAQRISTVSQKYDHVIIDTPPILAYPDALVWAKMADAVILVSLAGKTIAPDLKEAKEKLVQMNVKVLGTVLSNVPAGYGYYRYGYNYYTQDVRQKTSRNSATKNRLLLPPAE